MSSSLRLSGKRVQRICHILDAVESDLRSQTSWNNEYGMGEMERNRKVPQSGFLNFPPSVSPCHRVPVSGGFSLLSSPPLLDPLRNLFDTPAHGFLVGVLLEYLLVHSERLLQVLHLLQCGGEVELRVNSKIPFRISGKI